MSSSSTRAARAPFPISWGGFSAGYYAWRSKNAASIEKVQATSDYATGMKNVEDGLAGMAKAPQALRDMKRSECEFLLERAFSPPSLAARGKPIDAWNGMTAALRAADIDKALSFVSPGARSRYREVFTKLGADGTRSAADQLGEFRMTSQMGDDLAFGLLTRIAADGKKNAFEVSFMRDRTTGAWYIESM
jgi:hypothetical protein